MFEQDTKERGCFTVGAGIDAVTTETCADVGNWLHDGMFVYCKGICLFIC